MAKVEEIIAKILGISEKEITDESSPDNIENWDSFNSLLLVSELESAFKVSFTTDEVIRIKKIGDIKKALIKHRAILDK